MAPGDLIGRSLGHFRIVEKIGEGGMGIVYVAMDERLRRTVALKVLRPEVADDQRRRARFLREARFAASLAHPNVCAVHEVGESDGHVYMAMEMLEGASLRKRLGRARMAPARALTILRDVARALARAHEKGIIHRDLKPDNVMVYEPNPGVLAAKVLDFGLAKALDLTPKKVSPEHENTATFVTAHGVAIGTPGYMAPEQARGLEVDARADVYSFGVMMHEMLTGRSPYKGRSPEELIAAAGREDLPRPSELVAGLSPAIDALYMRCVDRSISRRFPNGAALVDALQSLVEPDTKPAPARSAASIAFDEVTSPHVLPTISVPVGVATQSLGDSDADEEEDTSRRPPTVIETIDDYSLATFEPAPRLSSTPPPPISIPSPPIARRGVRAFHVVGFLGMSVLAFFVARMAVVSTNPAVAATPVTSAPIPVVLPSPSPVEEPAPAAELAVVAPKPTKTTKPISHRAPARPAPTPSAAAPTPAPSPAPAPAPVEDCSNPFYVNAEGIRVPKRQCLR